MSAEQLPVLRTVAQLPDGTWAYTDQAPALQRSQQPVVVQHIHQAPPDRTLQRVALGAGAGAGAVVAGVYFGPLLVAVLTAMAADLALLALVAAAAAWGVVTVVRSIGGPDGKAAAQTLSKLRKDRSS